MAYETRMVKCEDCGRTLPGPPRKCDVCDGKMTYRAAESFYTPDGIISRRQHAAMSGKPLVNKFNMGQKPTYHTKPNSDYASDPVKNLLEINSRYPAVKYILIVAIILMIIMFVINLNEADYHENYTITDVVATETYELQMYNVDYSEYGDNAYADVYFDVTVDSSEDISINPVESIAMYDDYEINMPIEFVSIIDDYGDEYQFNDIEESFVMERGAYYEFRVRFEVDEYWSQFTLQHAFGGNLLNRDKSTDILIDRDSEDNYDGSVEEYYVED